MQKFLSFIAMIALSASVVAHNSAVVLQYHHVSVDTPPVTSVTPKQFVAQLDWLKDNNFIVMPLNELVQALRSKKRLSHDRVVAITFDDGAISVCEQAWPILKERKLPFTMFVNTEAIEKKYRSNCSWQQLKEMAKSPLVTIANHAHQHLNMVSKEALRKSDWSETMRNEVELAQSLIEKNIGPTPRLFAYPYGEYNNALADMVKDMGYVAFGQQSGPVGFDSDWRALPRFSGSGQYGRLETLSAKLLSLPFPIVFEPIGDNPVSLKGPNNPPKIFIRMDQNKTQGKQIQSLNNMNCFNGLGERMAIQRVPDRPSSASLFLQAPEALSAGRHRYTCTQPSAEAGRFYWFSHQWLVE